MYDRTDKFGYDLLYYEKEKHYEFACIKMSESKDTIRNMYKVFDDGWEIIQDTNYHVDYIGDVFFVRRPILPEEPKEYIDKEMFEIK